MREELQVLSCLAVVVLVVLFACAPQQPEAQTPPATGDGELVVAVTNFLNHSKNPELDPLGSGFASMFTTDLSKVDGLQVVERERLADLLAELELARSEFIDPKTAGALGHGVGATHILTGGYSATDESIRIDARLVDVATGEVSLAETKEGALDDVFKLEATLVGRLTASLRVKFPGTGSRAADFQTFRAYSTAIHKLDSGQLEAARKQLELIVKRQPDFDLAADELAETKRRINAVDSSLEDLPEKLVVMIDKVAAGDSSVCAQVYLDHASLAQSATAGSSPDVQARGKRLGDAYRLLLYARPLEIPPDRCKSIVADHHPELMLGQTLLTTLNMLVVSSGSTSPKASADLSARRDEIEAELKALDGKNPTLDAQLEATKDAQKMQELMRTPDMLNPDGSVLIPANEFSELILKIGNDLLNKYPSHPLATNWTAIMKSYVND